MQATLAELATLVDGSLIGDGELPIQGAAPLGDAEPGQITLIDKPERSSHLTTSRASAVVAPRSIIPQRLPAIQVDDVHRAFAVIVARFHPPRPARHCGISSQAVIRPTAKLGRDVDVHPLAKIGRAHV